MSKLLMIFLSVFISSLGQIILKFGAIRFESIYNSKNTLLKMFNTPTLIGLSLYGLSAFLWMIVLRKADLSYAYPMVSFGYILIYVASYFLFNESINLTRIIGLAVIIIGIIILSKS